MKNIKRIAAVLLVLTFAFSMVACGKKSTTSSGNSAPIKIAVSAWNPNIYMYLAKDLGYFDEEGVKVELVDFVEFADVPKAFNAGQLDGGFFSSFEVIAPASLDVDIKLVSVVDNSVGADALLANNGITSLEELKGKSIGLGMDTVSHIFLMLLVEEEGYSLSDFNLVDFSSPSSGASALLTGNIDALATFEPFISSCQGADENIKVVADTAKYPTMINDCIAFSGSIIKNRHDDVVKVMKAFYKAIDYWKANPDDANAKMCKYLDCSAEDFADTMVKLDMISAADAYSQMTATGEGTWTASMASMSKFLLERERLSKDIEPSKYVDTSILAGVLGK